MKNSLRKKLSFIGVLLIGTFVILNIILTYFLFIPFATYICEKNMEKIAISLEGEKDYKTETFADRIDQISEDMDTQITVVDQQKNIIATTRANEFDNNVLGPNNSRTFLRHMKELDEGKIINLTRERQDEKSIHLKLIKKIADDRYIILSRSIKSLHNATYTAILFNSISGFFIIVVSIFVGYRLSHFLVIPIDNMKNAAEHISNLEFDTKVEVKSNDEIGQLGNAINKMSEHLEQNVNLLQEDIKTRKQLVRNLSHEIKSPIAVIMGYSERLKAIISSNPEKAIAYCDIISDESARVDGIVRVMLEFSNLEKNTEIIHSEKFKVKKLFQSIHHSFLNESIGRNINFTMDFEEKDIINADFTLIEAAVHNLVSNALNHGNEDSMEIRVKGQRIEEYYEISVYNSGSRIKEEELQSIWEPFNKEDKVRSRGNQGYGVGLSIVKEIVEGHNGFYKAENTENGVKFTIIIKG